MKAKYTPGPWFEAPESFENGDHADEYTILSSSGYIIGEAAGSCWANKLPNGDDVESKANFALMIAAPTMFEFIESIENDLGLLPEWMVKWRAEILKAVLGE